MTQQDKPWTVQWHIVADGTVIRQRSKGDEPHEQLFGRHATNRQLELADLEALDDRLARNQRLFDVLSAVLVCVGVIDVVALVAGMVLAWVGVEAGGAIVMPALLLLVGLMIAMGAAQGFMLRRFNRVWTDAGFTSSNQVTMAASEARALIAAPGAVSGRPVRVKNA